MPRYFHVTKPSKLPAIQSQGLKVSSGAAAGGMSADSNSAPEYAAQDRDLIYLWTSVGYTDKFKVEKTAYALLVVDVDLVFDGAHIDVTAAANKLGKVKGGLTTTTVVCDAGIPAHKIWYYKTKADYESDMLTPLSDWGKFSMATEKKDARIWEGEV